MSNSFMRSSYFQTQVNNANVIKNCYPCGSNCTVTAGSCNCVIPSNLTLSTLTVNGLIDASGLQFNPVLINPGQNPSTTLWSNAMDMNRLYYGNSSVGGGGGGGVNSVVAGTNISTSGTASDPIINFNPGGVMNMNGAYLTNVNSISSLSSNITFNSSYLGLETRGINTEIRHYDITGTNLETQVKVQSGGQVSITSSVSTTGLVIGYDSGTSYNILRGQGKPLIISQSAALEPTDYILFDTVGDGTGGFAIANSEYVDVNAGIDFRVNANGNVVIYAGAGGYYRAGSGTTTGFGIEVESDEGVRLKSIASTITLEHGNSNNVTIMNTSGSDPVLNFQNSSSPNQANASLTYGTYNNYDGSGSSLLGNFYEMGLSSGGAGVEAIRMGITSNENYIYGGGNPLLMKSSYNTTGAIKIESDVVFAGNQNGTNASDGLLVGANGGSPRVELVIDSATASAGLRYDGLSATPVQFHFNGTDFLTGTAGGSSNQFLRIFVNGNEYKIALLNPA